MPGTPNRLPEPEAETQTRSVTKYAPRAPTPHPQGRGRDSREEVGGGERGDAAQEVRDRGRDLQPAAAGAGVRPALLAANPGAVISTADPEALRPSPPPCQTASRRFIGVLGGRRRRQGGCRGGRAGGGGGVEGAHGRLGSPWSLLCCVPCVRGGLGAPGAPARPTRPPPGPAPQLQPVAAARTRLRGAGPGLARSPTRRGASPRRGSR